jgi:hypothetical protein
MVLQHSTEVARLRRRFFYYGGKEYTEKKSEQALRRANSAKIKELPQ